MVGQNWGLRYQQTGPQRRYRSLYHHRHSWIFRPRNPRLRSRFEDDSGYTNAIDVWPLGCIAYWVMALKLPLPNRQSLSSFSAGRIQFPSAELQKNQVSDLGVEFVISIMQLQPIELPTTASTIENT